MRIAKGSAPAAAAWLLGIGLTWVFWSPLWLGGGLVGGDLYTYFFPLKSYYAEQLHAGRLPLWNPRIGHGVPIAGESQTAPVYPPNLLLYRFLPLNDASNASFLLHYVLAFGFMYHYGRRLGWSWAGAVLGALSFVYGWFAPRACLEWAAVTGAWIPLILLGVEGWIQSGRARSWVLIALGLGLQLLAGHYNLAFITLLIVTAYAPLRLLGQARAWRRKAQALGWIAVAMVLGFGLAAIQVGPSWQYKQRSDRNRAAFQMGLNYGRIPVWYWSQAVLPWVWYADDPDVYLSRDTNKVEAHLYFGLIPLGLAVVGFMHARRFPGLVPWAVLGLGGLVLMAGWLAPVVHAWPGFGYFRYPGRYGIIVQLAVAVAASCGLDVVRRALRPAAAAAVVVVIILGLTTCDLWWVAQRIQYVALVRHPPLRYRDASPVRAILMGSGPAPRVLARGPNLASLCGAACVPPYLGIEPVEYSAAEGRLPKSFAWDHPLSRAAHAWLRSAGVTHIIAFEPLDTAFHWPVTQLWSGYDPFLHRAWGRSPAEPLFLFRLNDSLGRAYVTDPSGRAQTGPDSAGSVDLVADSADQVILRTDLDRSGWLILTDLDYPGWTVMIDGRPAAQRRQPPMYRKIAIPRGLHQVRWAYRPGVWRWSAWVSLLSAILVLGAAGQIGRAAHRAAGNLASTGPARPGPCTVPP